MQKKIILYARESAAVSIICVSLDENSRETGEGGSCRAKQAVEADISLSMDPVLNRRQYELWRFCLMS